MVRRLTDATAHRLFTISRGMADDVTIKTDGILTFPGEMIR